jgi:hypothetical protein
MQRAVEVTPNPYRKKSGEKPWENQPKTIAGFGFRRFFFVPKWLKKR